MSTHPGTLRRDTRVFISAVTCELGSVRKLVKKGLEDNDYHAVEQDNFPPYYRDLKEKLRERIKTCDAVVHIAGQCYGAEPNERPADAPRRSYTQLEYDIALELGKPVYVFLTGDKFPADPHEPESAELHALQEAHRRSLTATGRDYNPTDSLEQLDQKIRSLQLKVERLGEELHRVDREVAVTGGRLRRWLVAVAVVGIITLGAVGYFGWRQEVELRAFKDDHAKVVHVQQEFAERFLQQLVTNREITAEEARQRALKELPALVQFPMAEITSLIDRKVVLPVAKASLSSLDRARAALAQGNYDGVFAAAADEKQQGRELAMLEGTAALARFRQSPKPGWNARALAAFQRAMALADPNSSTEWKAWTVAAGSAAKVLGDLARYAEAEPLLRDCLQLCESHSGPNSPEVAVFLNNLALLLEDTNRMAEAEPLMRRVLSIEEGQYGPNDPHSARGLNNLALLLKETNRLAEAEPLYRRALSIDEGSYGPAHPDVALEFDNLAQLLRATNRMAEAEPLMRRALSVAERSYGPEHRDVTICLDSLASLLQDTNRPAEAEPLMRHARSIAERSYGPDRPMVAICLDMLASSIQAADRLAEAEPLYCRAVSIDEGSYGPDHPRVATDLNNLALLLQATNRLAEAEPLMARAVRVFSQFQRATGHEHPDLHDVVSNYRQLLSEMKLTEPETAARIKAAGEGTDKLSPIVPEVERLLGPAKPVADVLAALDRQYKKQGKPEVYSLKPNEPIAPHLAELLRPNADALNTCGVAALRGGAPARALVDFEAALELMADQPAAAPAKLWTRINRAAAMRELRLVEEARDDLLKLLPEIEENPGTDSAMKGRVRYHLALCEWPLGDRAAAQRSAVESVVSYEDAPEAQPVDPAWRRQSEELLGDVKNGKAPPPLAAHDAAAELAAARTSYRACEALAKLPLDQQATPLLDQLLGPARSTAEVFEALDRQYRAQGKSPVWFLPLSEPIAPHLDELLGKAPE